MDGWDTVFLEISEPHCSSHLSSLSKPFQLPFGSASSSVEDLNSDAEASLPSHIGSFKTSLISLPSSGFVSTHCDDNVFFGSPATDDGCRGLTHGPYSLAYACSSKSTLGLSGVSGLHKPLSTIDPGRSRDDPILISDLPAQSELPSAIFGSPPLHSTLSPARRLPLPAQTPERCSANGPIVACPRSI